MEKRNSMNMTGDLLLEERYGDNVLSEAGRYRFFWILVLNLGMIFLYQSLFLAKTPPAEKTGVIFLRESHLY